MKGRGEWKRYTQLNAEFQRIGRRDNKVILNEQCKNKQTKTKKTEANNRMEKTRDIFMKIGDIKRICHARMSMHKGQKW